MEMRAGYKQTGVGIIPKDWCSKSIGDFIDLLTGFPFPSRGYTEDGIRLLRGSNVKRGSTDWAPEITCYWPNTTPELRRYLLKPGDIVVAMDGSLVGRSFASLSNSDTPALLLQRVARIRTSKVSQAYLRSWICSQIFTDHCDAVKTTTAIPHISPDDIRSFQIATPPNIEEQEDIANALSDADALIESLEQLLAKKRQIKQGVMQELLTGKRRIAPPTQGMQGLQGLPYGAFPADWKVLPLNDICAFVTKGSTPTTYGFRWQDDGILFLRSECVSQFGLDLQQSMFIGADANRSLRRSEVHDGDILMTITGNVGRVVMLPEGFGEANINQHIARIRVDREGVSRDFLFHFLSQPAVRHYYELITTGQAYPQISLKQVRTTELPLPDLEEQIAIASTLSDLDEDIRNTEVKLSKARQLKQGMMQELLTGRIRLV